MSQYGGERFGDMPIHPGNDIKLEEIPLTETLNHLYRYEEDGVKKMDTFRTVETYSMFRVIKETNDGELSWVRDQHGDSFITRVDAMRAIINNIRGVRHDY